MPPGAVRHLVESSVHHGGQLDTMGHDDEHRLLSLLEFQKELTICPAVVRSRFPVAICQ